MPDEWIILERNYCGKPFLYLVQRKSDMKKFFFKAVRPDHRGRTFCMFFNELLCHELAKRLGIVTIETFHGEVDSLGIGDFTPDEATKDLSNISLSSIINLHDFKRLAVFDQFVHNEDVKPSHIMVRDNGKVYPVDYDQALNSNNSYNWEERRMDECCFMKVDYGLRDLLDVKDLIQDIQQLSDEEIDELVDKILAEILIYSLTDIESDNLKSNAKVVKTLLKTRRDSLEKNMGEWIKMEN